MMRRMACWMAVAGLAVCADLANAEAIDMKMAETVLAKGETVAIWPEGKVPARRGESRYKIKDTNGTILRLSDVDFPEISFFRAPGEGAKPAVLVCPGGGYSILAYNHEGTEIAEWLNGQGYSAFVLKYRCPGQPDAALMDAQRALSLIRSRAEAYGINPKKLGIMGFSAGANLTVRTSTNHKTRAYEAVDEADRFSCRPDFSIVVYPWTLAPGENSLPQLPLTLRPTFPVDQTTPPAFIIQAEDDGCHVENSLAYFAALKFAGVKAEMHCFPDGGHGYGMRKHGRSVDGWENLLAVWLKRMAK
ncbi:MAG: alpha/beta hydrolase [Kiritimatiellae bacterium]|nr:alpha/beta hydrolase [Kiritimatiellia bacterium]